MARPEPVNGYLQVPVYAATRQPGDGSFYILAPGMDFDEFREIMVTAQITTEPLH